MKLEDDAHFMDIYSRQIGVYGLEAMGKLVKLKVFIMGLRGIGLETAKNLILSGPNTVTIHDDNLVTWGDLGTNFYAKNGDVGKTTRAACVLGKLKELNPMVNVNSYSGDIGPNVLEGYHVCVVTE